MILGIESSCDDTAIAIVDESGRVIKEEIITQAELHAKFGGVVPEVASRNHLINLQKAFNNLKDIIEHKKIKAICATAGPGLIGGLIVGVAFGQGLARFCKIPFIPINHLEGHILSAMIENPNQSFPFISLLVSGGHSQIILAKNYGEYITLGKTLDDAPGETFDKIGRLLGLPYPAGAKIDSLARNGIPRFTLPLPTIKSKDINMSFSGLKTAAFHLLKKIDKDIKTKQVLCDFCASLEMAISTVLKEKMKKAILSVMNSGEKINSITLCGGVASNSKIRADIQNLANENNLPCYIPSLHYCTDNGAMIALAGYKKYNQYSLDQLHNSRFVLNPIWSIKDSAL